MKRITFALFLLFASTGISFAQNQVRDVFPNASISVIDYQNGQQYLATSDDAILFKDAFINLVINTQTARMHNARMVAGRKTVTISQADPQANGNAFQLNLETTFSGQTTVVYSFLYNVDQNTLYYYNPSVRNWVPELVQGNNVINLNNCLAYGKFNFANAQPTVNAPGDNQGGDGSEYDSPVDTEVSAEVAPPPLPEYQQPECPEEGYLWQPGYWAYSPMRNDYYWVPGVWVAPPTVGYLWTPPYWGFMGGRYIFHVGYWGSRVGFYGGINYGFGYVGVGFVGGEWHENRFRYNTAVVRVNTVVVHNTYVNNTVINNTTIVNNNRVSFNGQGGVTARPSQNEIAATNDHHVMATAEQNRNQQLARNNQAQFASANHGSAPASLAAPRPPEKSAFNNNNSRNPGNAGQRDNNQRNGAPGNIGQRPNGNTSPGSNPNVQQGTAGQRPNPSVNGNQRPNPQGAAGVNPNVQQGTGNQRPNPQGAPGVNPNVPQGNGNQRPNPQGTQGVNPNTQQGNGNQRPNPQGSQGVNPNTQGNGNQRPNQGNPNMRPNNGGQQRNNNRQPKQQPRKEEKDNKKQ